MNETKKRAGRPFNSVTTVKVKMIDLLGVVLPECEVVVGRKWADSVGVNIIEMEFNKIDPFFNINTREDLEKAKIELLND